MDDVDDRSYRIHQTRSVREYEQMLRKTSPLPMITLRVSITEETEYCHERQSRLHRLTCGHIVHTQQATACGRNCAVPQENYLPFLCTLCERWKMVRTGRNVEKSSAVTELIMPDFPEINNLHIPVHVRPRHTYIACVLPNGRVFVPYAPKDIAMARITYQRDYETVLLAVGKTVGVMGYPIEIAQAAERGLVHCVYNQHQWVTATYEELAAICVYVAASRAGVNTAGLLAGLKQSLDASVDNVRELAPGVTKLLVEHDARAFIAKSMPVLERMCPKLSPKLKVFASMVLKLWRQTQQSGAFSIIVLRDRWLHIVVCCIHTVMLINGIAIPIHKICDALGSSYTDDVAKISKRFLVPNIMDDKVYSFDDLTSEARRHRKLGSRRTRQAVRERAISRISDMSKDAFTVHVFRTAGLQKKQTDRLRTGFGKLPFDQDVRPGTKRRIDAPDVPQRHKKRD